VPPWCSGSEQIGSLLQQISALGTLSTQVQAATVEGIASTSFSALSADGQRWTELIVATISRRRSLNSHTVGG